MKAISMNQLNQVSGGTGSCLLNMMNVGLGTTTCLAYLSEDMSTIEIPLTSVLPAIAAAAAVLKVGKELYSLYQNSGEYKFQSTIAS